MIPVQAQTDWTKHDQNPVVAISEPWEHLINISEPTCLQQGGTFRMWLVGAHEGVRSQIYHAVSADGITWWRHHDPVLEWGAEGEWDHFTMDTPEVIRDDEGYKLYYYGQPESTGGLPFNGTIGTARSADGINWEKYEENPVLDSGGVGDWDEYWVESPDVVFNPQDGTYEMWYSGYGGGGPLIGYAVSDDGEEWEKHPTPVLPLGDPDSWDDGGVVMSTVVKRDGLYEMWYCGGRDDGAGGVEWDNLQIGYATSTNGYEWDKYPFNPVLSRNDPPADITAPKTPDVVFSEQGSRYLLWYATDYRINFAADPNLPAPVHHLLVAGAGPAPDNPPLVRTFPAVQDASHMLTFSAYGAMEYGVNLVCGNLDGDPAVDQILCGAGPGAIYGPHVRGFTLEGLPVPGLSFLAYGTNKYGVNVAAGDIDGDGYDEIITGAGPGAVFGPHVRAFDYDGAAPVSPVSGVNYFAYGTLKYGVNVTAGDIDGDGFDEIITGAGPGTVFGPHVRGWNFDGGTAAAIPAVSYFAYGSPQYGVNVACGDLDGDGVDEIVTGAGPGPLFGAHVRGWNVDGGQASAMPGINFFAWEPSDAGFGARVWSGLDLNGNGRDELLVGCGPDPDVAAPVKVYRFNGAQAVEWFSFQAFPGLTRGCSVAAAVF